MNKALITGILVILFGVGYVFWSVGGGTTTSLPQSVGPIATTTQEKQTKTIPMPDIFPVAHASFVLAWDAVTIFCDPVGDPKSYVEFGAPNIILLTDIHSDHLSTSTLMAISASGTVIVAPQAVADKLPPELPGTVQVMANNDSDTVAGIAIGAMPMYNLPETPDSYHPKGRGNGYLLQRGDTRVYIAGDTGPIPEMKALKNITLAFVPMNLPFTMDVQTAAAVVLDFAPRVVVPYHYRGTEGLSDVAEFKKIVESTNPEIAVKLLDWYPEED